MTKHFRHALTVRDVLVGEPQDKQPVLWKHTTHELLFAVILADEALDKSGTMKEKS